MMTTDKRFKRALLFVLTVAFIDVVLLAAGMTLPSECVSHSRRVFEEINSSRRSRRGGGNVEISLIDFHISTACFG